jgi:acyl-coenzyme A thioesterase PaaI-like protein
VGGGAAYYGITNYKTVRPSKGLERDDETLINTYLHHHKLEKMLKQSVMNGYMQLSKAFLDYGLREKMEGFFFYGTYFEKEQLEASHITKAYCVFSPKEQLCGHPGIQHGGATATIVDQNSGILAMLYSYELVATGELNVKYKKPVKKGQIYVWKGEVAKREDRKIYVSSVVQELETGIVCAEVEALMVTVNW